MLADAKRRVVGATLAPSTSGSGSGNGNDNSSGRSQLIDGAATAGALEYVEDNEVGDMRMLPGPVREAMLEYASEVRRCSVALCVWHLGFSSSSRVHSTPDCPFRRVI